MEIDGQGGKKRKEGREGGGCKDVKEGLEWVREWRCDEPLVRP